MLLDLFDIDGFYVKTINPEFDRVQNDIDLYGKIIDLRIYNNKKRIKMPSLVVEHGDKLFNTIDKYFREHEVFDLKKEQMKVENIQVVQDREYFNCFVYTINIELNKSQLKKYKE